MNAFNPSLNAAFQSSKKYDPLPGRGLLAAAGFDLKIARRAAPEPLFDRPPLLNGLVRPAAGENYFLAGPVLGAPMAVMALEELIRRGAREIIFVGLAGGLVNKKSGGDLIHWSAGDLFLPAQGLSTEGTSAHYPAPLRPDAELCFQIRRAAGYKSSSPANRETAAPLRGLEGTIWSTDAIFRETAELALRQWSLGALAVDMECTALWAAAAFRGVRLAALLVISDILTLKDASNPAMEHQIGFHQPAFKQGLAQAAETAWRALTATPPENISTGTICPKIGENRRQL